MFTILHGVRVRAIMTTNMKGTSLNTQHQETEAKFYTPDHAPLLQALQAQGALCVAPRILERNTRYTDPANSFSARGIVLRLRQDAKVRLTYKEGVQVQEGIVTRTELEVDVSDFDTAHAILTALGYRAFMRYDKYRTTYTLDGVEVVLDELPYGNFTELEGEASAIERVATALGLQGAPRYAESYVVLFERVKAHLGMSADDLTFEAFAGVVVPPSAFGA
jgi:adenylate cyclase class 2